MDTEKGNLKESFDSSGRCVENAGDEVTIAVCKGMGAAKAHEKRGSFAAAFFSAAEPGTLRAAGRAIKGAVESVI